MLYFTSGKDKVFELICTLLNKGYRKLHGFISSLTTSDSPNTAFTNDETQQLHSAHGQLEQKKVIKAFWMLQ